MTRTRIPEIELNFCNVCTADCMICSSTHGWCNRNPDNKMMPLATFNRIVEQMRNVDFEFIMTHGNGDSFLNKNFIHYLRTLRSEFPKAQIYNYSNFLLYTPAMTDIILGEQLINKQHTRVDSINTDIYSRSTGVDTRIVFANLEYFIRKTTKVPIEIGYCSIPDYYNRVKKMLGKLPLKSRFSEEEVAAMQDEYEAVCSKFRSIPTKVPVQMVKINQSLWGERNDLTITTKYTSCPKADSTDRIAWVCPNGNLTLCGYDDGQDTFVYGNVNQDTLVNLWNSEKRREVKNEIIGGFKRGRYPCNNTDCCILSGPV